MVIQNGELHHRSVSGVFQHCVSAEEGQEFYVKSMKGIVVTMPVQNPWWLKLFIMGSIG